MSGRPPDWRVNALNKYTGKQGEIGVAWSNPEGHITIVFNPFVVVPVSDEVVISMFPTDKTKWKGKSRSAELGDDEIPF